jgi:hypothetical protein
MRHFFLFFALMGITISGFAQNNNEAELKKEAERRADREVEYISKHMKNLSPKDIAFLKNSFTTKFLYVTKYTRGQNITTEYKKAIYKKANDWMKAELNKRFSTNETKQILTLFTVRRKHNKQQLSK